MRSFARRYALTLAITLVACGLVVIGFEAYLRSTQMYVEEVTPAPPTGEHRGPDAITMHNNDGGRRLIPGAHIVIRNHALSGIDVEVKLDRFGFRGDDVPVAKAPDELRVIALGDSITLGDYLPAEQVYVERAQHHLRAALPHKRVEVINAGVDDIGLREEIDILEERGLQLQPDVVSVGFYVNDSRPPMGFAGELGAPGWLRRTSVLAETIYRNFELNRWLRDGGHERMSWVEAQGQLPWRRDRDAFAQLARVARYDWGAGWEESAWPEIDAQLGRLHTLSQRHGFAVVVLSFPVAFQVDATFVEDTPQQRLAALVARRDWPLVDMLPLIRAAHEGRRVFYDQCHPLPWVNELAGERLASAIVDGLETSTP